MKKNQQSRCGDLSGRNEAERAAEAIRRYLKAAALANQQRSLVLHELLSMPGCETLPPAEQEFFELSIEESDDAFRPGFIVTLTHARWGEVEGQVMWEDPEMERWPTLNKAKERCEEWRKALAAKGFTRSDLDV